MNTIENNKIIAEFMGIRPKSELDGVYSWSDMPFYSIRENDIDKVWLGISEYVKYSSDWNRLMEVVEKIISLKNTYAQERQKVFNSISPNIQTTYNACLEFIKWYNKQNS